MNRTQSVTQEWTHRLSFMQQTVLISAVRAPDGMPKYHPVKFLLRWYRRCVLVSSLDGCVITDPFDGRGGSFMGPSYYPPSDSDITLQEAIANNTWQEALTGRVSEYLQSVDEIPHHAHLHFMHAVQIVGYKHPDADISLFWRETYLRFVNDMHLHPETEEEMDIRLGDDRAEFWRGTIRQRSIRRRHHESHHPHRHL